MKYVDNYIYTIKAIKEYIVDYAPSSLLETDREKLDKLVIQQDSYLNSFYINFKKEIAGTNSFVDLCIDLTSDFIIIADKKNNAWYKYKAVYKLNYSDHILSDLSICSLRINFITEILNFAKDIENKFNYPVYKKRA